jgi:hypothetical protein
MSQSWLVNRELSASKVVRGLKQVGSIHIWIKQSRAFNPVTHSESGHQYCYTKLVKEETTFKLALLGEQKAYRIYLHNMITQVQGHNSVLNDNPKEILFHHNPNKLPNSGL